MDKKNAPASLQIKEKRIKDVLSRIGKNSKEKQDLNAELSKIKGELAQLQRSLFKKLLFGYKDRVHVLIKARKEGNARLAEEKKKIEDEFKKQREREELIRKQEEEKADKGKKRTEDQTHLRAHTRKPGSSGRRLGPGPASAF